MVKRYVRAAAIAIATALLLVGIAAVALVTNDSADLSYHSIKFEATALANGDLKVTQHFDYKLDERTDDDGDVRTWKQLYANYTLDAQNLTDITDISVTNVTTGQRYSQINPQLPTNMSDEMWNSRYAGHWYIADVSNGSDYPEIYRPGVDGLRASTDYGATKELEIGWNIPATEQAESLKFDVTMTLHDVATKYNDVTEIIWNPISTANEAPIGEISGTVTFPDGIDADSSWAWLHTTNTSETKRGDNGSLEFAAYNLGSGDYINLVMAFDSSKTSNVARSVNKDALDTIKDSETKQERSWRNSQSSKSRLRLLGWVVGIIAGLGLCIAAIWGLFKANKYSKYSGNIDYWRDEPGVSPACAARLIDVVDTSTGTVENRSMSSTVMALAAKKAIAIFPGSVDLYQGIDLTSASVASIGQMISTDPEKAKKAAKNSTIVLLPAGLAENRQSALNLCQSEEALMELLVQVSDRLGATTFDLDQMHESCKTWSEGYQVLQNFENACDEEFTALDATRNVRWLTLVPGMLAAVLAAIIVAVNAHSGHLVAGMCIGLPIMLIGVFCACAGKPLALTEKGQEYAGKCLGLKRYMQDFSNFKDRGTEDMTLWDWYMVYAASFGISERAAKELAKAYPQVSDSQWLDNNLSDSSVVYWGYRSMGWYDYSPASMLSGTASATTFGSDAFAASFSDMGSQISAGLSDIRNTIQMSMPSGGGDEGWGGSGGSFSGGGFGGFSGGSGGGSFGGR